MHSFTSTVKWVLAGVACAVPIVLGSTVQAADPVAGCGKGAQLVTVEGGLALIDWRIYSAQQQDELSQVVRDLVDANGDGWICVKQFGPSLGISNKWTDREFADYVVTRLGENKANGQLG